MARSSSPLYLFFDLPADSREKLLKVTAKRLKTMTEDLRAKVDRINAEEALARRPHKAYFRMPDLMSRDLIEFEGGIHLDDGFYRLVVETKLGALEIFNGQRFERPELAFVSKMAAMTSEMLNWPTLKVRASKASPKRKLIHWRTAGTARMALVLIREGKDRNFYLDWPSEVPGVPPTRWHFLRRFSPSDRGDEWFMIRPDNLSRGVDLQGNKPEAVVLPKKKNKVRAKSAPVRERVKCEICKREMFPHPRNLCVPCQEKNPLWD